MENEVFCELNRLMEHFPGSFMNHDMELILIPKTNTYFLTEDCKTKNDVIAKVLMWCSRTIAKGQPFHSEKRNILFRDLVKMRLNDYLGTMFSDEDVDLIYQKLGNGINGELTYQFIESGFDMDWLIEELEK